MIQVSKNFASLVKTKHSSPHTNYFSTRNKTVLCRNSIPRLYKHTATKAEVKTFRSTLLWKTNQYTYEISKCALTHTGKKKKKKPNTLIILKVWFKMKELGTDTCGCKQRTKNSYIVVFLHGYSTHYMVITCLELILFVRFGGLSHL